ncbi:ScpA family protein [Stappia sp. ES.058]|uniref:segregation and condensation protein A n=1 Tax=Stappia sp. ES.058 TaxID=1881061 RepID=UPI0008795152|nr:ScpA family protein [Stappia sp. ES.058]SDU12521.1 condensin subunit ScpA [Stappia sp. ES.058]
MQDSFFEDADRRGTDGSALATTDPSLVVDVDGFEGPLDLLLTLARKQKVDLARISILALVEQYLHFVNEAHRLRLELAADYLVMAAWLAYLKSRLLIPEQKDEDALTGEELAAALAFRLRRLEAMREASAKLMNRNRLGRDVFVRGDPETLSIERKSRFAATLYDLLTAYAAQRQRTSVTSVHVRRRTVWSLQEARDLLTRLVGKEMDWAPLDAYLSRYLGDGTQASSVLASSFSASLELVREGAIELRQSGPFARLYLRRRAEPRPGEARDDSDPGTEGNEA